MKHGEQVSFPVDATFLPGEFVLRFNYQLKDADTPRPAELPLILNKQDITVSVNPEHIVPDSVTFENDRENITWKEFSIGNVQKRNQLGLLQQLLNGYSNKQAAFWKSALQENITMTKEYNQWLEQMSRKYNDLYISHLFSFQYIPDVDWSLPLDEHINQQIDHWFDGCLFNDSTVLKSQQMNNFLNQYINLVGTKITSEALKDSLLVHAGRLVCEKASQGNPLVYGYVVDYFYRGYEAYNIQSGIKMLEKYADDPRCITTRKKEIVRRLEGIGKMLPGTVVKNLHVEDIGQSSKDINLKASSKTYQLVIFYESACGHCSDLLAELKKWYAIPQNREWFDIYTIAVDEKRETWEKSHHERQFPWNDYFAPGGVNSETAAAYYVLSTPNLFIIGRDGKLINLPAKVADLDKFLNDGDSQFTPSLQNETDRK